jgi:regulator of replication initiation timing
MSRDNLPQTLPTLQKIIQRIAAAERSQQKEIRISIQEARELSLELSMLTARMSHNIQEIREAVKIMADNTQNIDVKFDGGGF